MGLVFRPSVRSRWLDLAKFSFVCIITPKNEVNIQLNLIFLRDTAGNPERAAAHRASQKIMVYSLKMHTAACYDLQKQTQA